MFAMRSMAPTFIELSHVVEAGMLTYPGLPAPESHVLVDHESSRPRYDGQAGFLIASLHLCGNTGTYVDSPFHRHRDGQDLADLPLDRLAHLPICPIDARHAGRAIGPELFAGLDLGGTAVLVRTDWSAHWGTPAYFGPHPFLTGQAAQYLRDAGAAFVGIDSLNIDDVADLARPVHTILLAGGIPICEHMTNLQALPPVAGRLHAVPIAWRGGASFPVRAYVVVPDSTPPR
jgi:arylformamidase